MERAEFVLAGLAAAPGALHSPVQVQKLFFLLDKNIAPAVGGPYFDFQPYSYGPFDKEVYKTLEALAAQGYVDLVPDRSWVNYRLSPAGEVKGHALLAQISQRPRKYLIRASHFVRSLTFSALVAAIYKAYPEMRANSVFQE